MNIEIKENDAAALVLLWTDAEPDGRDVFATLEEARREVIKRCIPERDAWAGMIRSARMWTRADIMHGSW